MENKKITTAIEIITPDIAGQYLKVNFEKNRPVNQSNVNKFAQDMRKGKFPLNPSSPIVFSDTGKLLNGQHRLLACIQSGATFTSFVSRGCSEELYKVMDIGASRTVADNIDSKMWRGELATLSRYTGATRNGETTIAGALKGYLIQTTGKHNKTHMVVISKSANIDEAETHKEELIDCLRIGEKMRKRIGKWGVPSYAYFVWLVRWTKQDVLLDDFVRGFCDYECTNVTINVTKQNMLKRAAKAGRTPCIWVVTALLYAYDAFCEGRKIRSLSSCETVIDRWNDLTKETRKANGIQ